MKKTVDTVMADLESYISLYNISLSAEARKTFRDVEEFAFKCDNPSGYEVFVSKLILNMKHFQEIFRAKGLNYKLASLILEKDYFSRLDKISTYDKGNALYSEIGHRSSMENVNILDKALEYCVQDDRDTIINKDILLATLDVYECEMDEEEGYWDDKRLNTDYATLSHIYGDYSKELWVKFDDIREHISDESIETITEKSIVLV
jgi:hypothetical protein